VSVTLTSNGFGIDQSVNDSFISTNSETDLLLPNDNGTILDSVCQIEIDITSGSAGSLYLDCFDSNDAAMKKGWHIKNRTYIGGTVYEGYSANSGTTGTIFLQSVGDYGSIWLDVHNNPSYQYASITVKYFHRSDYQTTRIAFGQVTVANSSGGIAGIKFLRFSPATVLTRYLARSIKMKDGAS
jgi:hypothetical protein